jgi:SAM-dependent methyltransferase
MPNAPTPHTPEAWGAASAGYSAKVAPLLMRSFADAIVERLDLGPRTEAIEIGAGSGALTDVLRTRVGSLLATDFSPQMVEILGARMEAAGASHVRCAVMDGQALDAEDDTFDAAACSFALMLFPDRAAGFSEMCRVLRPGGRAAISAWTGPDRFESFGLFLEGLDRALPDLPPPPSPPAVFSLADPGRFTAEMERGGFTDVEVDLVERELQLDGFDAMWAMLTAGAPPVQVLFEKIGPSGQRRLRDSLAEIVEDRFGSGPITLRNVATVGSGTAAR